MNDFIYDRDHDLNLTAAQASMLYAAANGTAGPVGGDATMRALARIGLADKTPAAWAHAKRYRLNDRGMTAARAIRARVDAGDVARMGRGERRMIAESPYMIPEGRRDETLISLLDDPIPTVRRRAAERLSDWNVTVRPDRAARLARHPDPAVRGCRVVVKAAPVEAYAHETDPRVIGNLIAEHKYDDMMIAEWLRSNDERVFNQALATVDDESLERLLRKGVFPGACVHEWAKRGNALEWDMVAHIVPKLDPDDHTARLIADHVIHVPDTAIDVPFEYRIREAAEAQVRAERLMSVFADPNGEAARRAVEQARERMRGRD